LAVDTMLFLLLLFLLAHGRHNSTVIATRYYGKSEDDFQNLQNWILKISSLSDHPVYIGVGSNLDKTDAVYRLHENFPKSVTVVEISNWGYSTVLNELVLHIMNAKISDSVLFVSPEVYLTSRNLGVLFDHLTDNTLVVGLALEGHEFAPGLNLLTALTSPWNTAALWSLEKLRRTGFLLESEKSGDTYGMEEVPVISLQQHLFGSGDTLAKLIQMPGVRWEYDFSDRQRRLKHERKMRSKLARASKQINQLNLQNRHALVEHISH